MPRLTNKIVDRIRETLSAWNENAPDAKFADMTLEEFETAVQPPITIRKDIVTLAKKLSSKKTKRADADKAAGDVLELVINSVRGTPGFGPDSAMYRACGYVRKSERKSGLTRKKKDKESNANAA